MKYLPKYILGAVISGEYLVLAGYFVWGFVFGSDGPHGEAGTSFLYAFFMDEPGKTQSAQ